MKLREILANIESFAPSALQESYDNAGLQVGDPDQEVRAALICIDVTEAVLEEAGSLGADLIISHHPLIFTPLKKIGTRSHVHRILRKAIQSDLAIYASHTNLDAAYKGVNHRMAEKMGLQEIRILQPMHDQLGKLVFFVPLKEAPAVREAIFQAGAGEIGEYDMCSFNTEGEGTFRGGEASNPFVGQKGKLHTEPELRVETIYPRYREKEIIRALLSAHPYEEVAYDLYALENVWDRAGAGAIGVLAESMEERPFLEHLKSVFACHTLRHTKFRHQPVRKVALCGGSGSFLISRAIAAGADAFVSADFKYHQFFDADGSILVADIGHYESEQFTKEIIYENLTKKIPTFAFHLSQVNTNPVNYF